MRLNSLPNSLYVILTTLVFIDTVTALKCYICQSYDSEPCPDEDLKDCPSSQAYDRCVVRMQRSSASDKMKVIRECALAPCSFQDKAFDNIFNLRRSCDMSKDKIDCFYCCKEDGCNRDDAYQLAPNSSTLFLTLIIMHLIANL